MDELIEKHCNLLEELKEKNVHYENRDDILNDFYSKLLLLQSSDMNKFRQQLNRITSLLCQNILVLNETILKYFLDYFVILLKQWYTSTDFNESSTFDNLSNIILQHSDQAQSQQLIDEFVQCLYAIARIGKDKFIDPNIHIITRILRNYTEIASKNRMVFMNTSVFADSITKCLCTSYTKDVFAQFKLSTKSNERNPVEQFVFYALFDHVIWMDRDQLQVISFDLRKNLLSTISNLLDEYQISSKSWSQSAIKIFEDLTTVFLYSVQLTTATDEDLDVQIHILETAIPILLDPEFISIRMIKNCQQYVYMGTLNDKLLDYLKTKELTSTLFKIIGMFSYESEIQFNGYRTLAALMTEDDIKQLEKPGAIAAVFLDHLREIKDKQGWETRIRNLLNSLKILLQHDQIRDEVCKQQGVPLFIYCATMPKYDTVIQQRAIEILLIMSFDENVRLNLKQNDSFMQYIKSLSEEKNRSDLQHASDSLFWILTKNDTKTSADNSQPSKSTYDIMISYSHKDQDFCFQLYDRLIKDNFRVWIDRDQMRGTPLESMSKAIENTEFVLVCMSDAYKQSGYCKMEAYYALERQCHIVPLVVKPKYKPDGWLGIIVTGRMRIDFPKYGFNNAYEKLLTEMSRNRNEMSDNKIHDHHELPSNILLTKRNTDEEQKRRIDVKADHKLPSSAEQWTVDDVQQFLLKNNFQRLFPICERMHGNRLIELYRMCSNNSPVMFQSLNNQLAATKDGEQRSFIEINEYLQFLDNLKPFVPVPIENKVASTSQSRTCTII